MSRLSVLAADALMVVALAVLPAAAGEVSKTFTPDAMGQEVALPGGNEPAATNAELGRLVESMLAAPDGAARYSAVVTSPANDSTLTVVVEQAVKTVTLASKDTTKAPVVWKVDAKTSPEEFNRMSHAVFAGLTLAPTAARGMDSATSARTK